MNSIQLSIQRAKKALRYYLNAAAPENNLAVRDMLADLKHYCDANAIDFYVELEAAHRHYTEEVVEARQSKAQGGGDQYRHKTETEPQEETNERLRNHSN